MPSLSPALDRAIRAYKEAIRRISNDEIALPMAIDGVDTIAAWLPEAKRALRRVRKQVERDVAVATAQVLASKSAQGDPKTWQRLDEALKKLEAELIAPSTLRLHLDVGKRSMMPKIEKLISEHLEPVVDEQGGHLIAEPDSGGLAKLESTLPDWINVWATYIHGGIATDRKRLIEQLWRPKEGDLPVQPPVIRGFGAYGVEHPIDFPAVSIERQAKGKVGSLFTKLRSGMYALMSVGFLFGINFRNEKLSAGMVVALFAGLIGALVFGIAQYQNERAQERERLREQVRTKAEQAIRTTLRAWADKCGDKIISDVRAQSVALRGEFVDWYRTQVLPAQNRRHTDSAARNAEAGDARSKLPKLNERHRDVKRAVAAFTKIESLAT
jgi:hypothetical protein